MKSFADWFPEIGARINPRAFAFAALIGVTTWMCLAASFGTAAFVDASRAGHEGATLARAFGAYALGFAPWLALTPALYTLARRQSRRRHGPAHAALETLGWAVAAFSFIFAYTAGVYPVLIGSTTQQVLSNLRLQDWSPDAFMFISAVLAGRAGALRPDADEDRARFASPAAKPRLVVRSVDRTDYVPVADILGGCAQGNYVALICSDREILHRATISALLDELSPYGFVRIHRSYFVRPESVAAISARGARSRELVLSTGKRLPVSDRYADALAAALDQPLPATPGLEPERR